MKNNTNPLVRLNKRTNLYVQSWIFIVEIAIDFLGFEKGLTEDMQGLFIYRYKTVVCIYKERKSWNEYPKNSVQ